jgi:hypothetical protein
LRTERKASEIRGVWVDQWKMRWKLQRLWPHRPSEAWGVGSGKLWKNLKQALTVWVGVLVSVYVEPQFLHL